MCYNDSVKKCKKPDGKILSGFSVAFFQVCKHPHNAGCVVYFRLRVYFPLLVGALGTFLLQGLSVSPPSWQAHFYMP